MKDLRNSNVIYDNLIIKFLAALKIPQTATFSCLECSLIETWERYCACSLWWADDSSDMSSVDIHHPAQLARSSEQCRHSAQLCKLQLESSCFVQRKLRQEQFYPPQVCQLEPKSESQAVLYSEALLEQPLGQPWRRSRAFLRPCQDLPLPANLKLAGLLRQQCYSELICAGLWGLFVLDFYISNHKSQ